MFSSCFRFIYLTFVNALIDEGCIVFILCSFYIILTYATSHILMDLFLLLLGNWPSSYSRSFSFVDDKLISHDPMEAVL